MDVLFQILWFSVPLTLYLGHCVHLSLRCRAHHKTTSGVLIMMEHLKHHLMFYIFIILHSCYGLREFYKAYGTMATVMGPIRTWSLLLAVVMRHWALNTDSRTLLGRIKINNGKIEHCS